MSNFLTPIPVHLDKLKAQMPEGATIDKVVYNEKTKSVEVQWHTSALLTKYLWAFPVSLSELEQQQWPDGVKTREQAEQEFKVASQAQKEADLAAIKAAEEKRIRDMQAAKKRADELAAQAAKVRSEKEKVLTGKEAPAKSGQREKLAGEPDHKNGAGSSGRAGAGEVGNRGLRAKAGRSDAANSTSGKAGVDGSRPATATGVSQVHHGQ